MNVHAGRKGFTLLEVVVALVILTMSLFVLVNAQGSSVFMTTDSQRTLTATWLAQQKMTEALLRIESDGVQESDVDEDGDFADFGGDGDFGENIDFGEEYSDFHWAYTIRSVDIKLGDVSGSADAMQGAGLGPSEDQLDASGSGGKDLSDLGVQPDMISELLKPYIREVRVEVWWGEEPAADEECEDCVELVTHVANPTGEIVAGSGADPNASTSAAGGN
ncbi:MAG: prepilin-type N-terminal cleavage/methylation domain-containing protein [Myxococcales bacterium]|nr:prepilin-type N-terminal cleavage/methylation domain-containing protein [Myxococcales bacterium]